MGNSQSTRKITVNNEASHIIKVSDSIIERLKTSNNNENVQTQPQIPVRQAPKLQTSTAPAVETQVTYAGSLTSLQALQEKERQLKENDNYWANRVRKLEEAQGSAKRLMEEEFTKTVSGLEARLPKVPLKLSEVPCSDKKAKVLDCFRNNPKQILLCAKEVTEFADCVDLKRLAAA